MKKVVLIGWHPSAVNYEKYPGLTSENLEASLRADETGLRERGDDARQLFIRTVDTALADVEAALSRESFKVVLIGAGVRGDPDCFLLFEALVNLVHEKAPRSKIAFNTGPLDSLEAVERWI